jgi:hypothetical protein
MAQAITRRGRPSHTPESLARVKARKLKKLLDTWLADESGYDERVWPRLKKAIEGNRPSYRKRFRD